MSTGASSWLCVALLVAACNEPLAPPHSKDKPPVAPGSAVGPGSAVAPIAPGSAVATDDHVGPVPPPPAAPVDAAPAESFYTVADAIADAKASPLKYVGIGAWPGNFSIKGCIYRNDRVFVVDVYCTYREQTAFSAVVISREKGNVRIYAEAEKPISTITRTEYFTFYAETYPPLADLPAPPLDAKFDDVTAWEDTQNTARMKLPALGACSTDIPSCADPAWLDSAKAFVKEPSDDWTWIVDQLRNRAQHDGKYVAKKASKK